jgi:hypothetical protein
MALGVVRERPGEVVTSSAAVRHQLFEQQFPGAEVEHPQPLLGGGARVVDHGEGGEILDRARSHGARGRRERELEHRTLD